MRGSPYLFRGFVLWRTRPGLMLLGMVPALLVALVLVAAILTLLLQLTDLVGGSRRSSTTPRSRCGCPCR
ncbi:hypothetical protein LRP67_10205 [Nocardioides sp. cx-169]|uniref:hypothetical protein n=1 Tax=Nocardioides sp. cx-169 TaxID=2899080 RepID=UPI001E3CD3A7|nr:hypothetical protein [Nocardioides sp. cx-169]MCD4534455.1 hypothetical protein [Nocardioides sp. cx-169]